MSTEESNQNVLKALSEPYIATNGTFIFVGEGSEGKGDMFQGHGLWAHSVCLSMGDLYSFTGYGSFRILIRLFQNSKRNNSFHELIIKKKKNISFPENDKYFKHY